MERRLQRDDYFLVRHQLVAYLRQQRRSKKRWTKFIDLDTGLAYIFAETTEAWIVGAYLVVYDMGTPWYANPDKHKFLSEMLVLRLVPGGDFSVVPAFLERKALEAGAVVAGAGTALAPNDKALARAYSRAGFNTEAFVLIKEITHERHSGNEEGG
ncbi:hypothetical protein [Caulobacter phage ERS]|uniref:Uncharacterized protein n=1 Tax=Caulobacter phage ERS TaxID=3020392 RepID=A0AAF0B9U9_9CAUD|nr:hypothetical protein [Caulobacter phage ERS]